MGESVSKVTYQKILWTISEISQVNIVTMKTICLSPHQILIRIEVNLIDDLNPDQIESVTDVIEQKIMDIFLIPKKNTSLYILSDRF